MNPYGGNNQMSSDTWNRMVQNAEFNMIGTKYKEDGDLYRRAIQQLRKLDLTPLGKYPQAIPHTPFPKVPTMSYGSQGDNKNLERIKTLHPIVRLKAMAHLKACDAQGIHLRITHGERTFAEQNLLYAQGRTAPGKIVTNAKGGQSWHNYCLAYDVVPLDNVTGKAIWDTKDPIWDTIIDLGKQAGMEHGIKVGKWIDMPHFQYRPGNMTIAEARELYNRGILHSWEGVI